jgi:hypothetical protein
VAHPPTVGTSTGDAAEQRRIAGVAGVGLHDDGGQVSRALRSGSRSTRTSTPCAASATSRWWSAAPQLMTRSRRPGSVATRCRFQSACNSTASSTIRYRQVPAAHPRDLSERAERAGTGLGFEHRGGAQGVLYGHDQPVGSVHCGPPLEACPFSRAGPRTRSRQGRRSRGPDRSTVPRPRLLMASWEAVRRPAGRGTRQRRSGASERCVRRRSGWPTRRRADPAADPASPGPLPGSRRGYRARRRAGARRRRGEVDLNHCLHVQQQPACCGLDVQRPRYLGQQSSDHEQERSTVTDIPSVGPCSCPMCPANDVVPAETCRRPPERRSCSQAGRRS